MSVLKDLKSTLGASPWQAADRSFDVVEADWGMELPPDFKLVGQAYGDILISDFLYIYGPLTLTEKSSWMSACVRRGEVRVIPRPVLPDTDGMLMWGHTIEGDRLFLERKESNSWTVSAFRRNWHDWQEYDTSIIDWLTGVLTGQLASEWMPEWPECHWFEL